jgi:hypothetical protein
LGDIFVTKVRTFTPESPDWDEQLERWAFLHGFEPRPEVDPGSTLLNDLMTGQPTIRGDDRMIEIPPEFWTRPRVEMIPSASNLTVSYDRTIELQILVMTKTPKPATLTRAESAVWDRLAAELAALPAGSSFGVPQS